MCILYLVVPGVDASSKAACPLLIANNRDEYLNRATARGSFHRIDSPSGPAGYAYYPQDLKAGGTWLSFDHGNGLSSRVEAEGEPLLHYRGCGAAFRFAIVLNFDEFRIGYSADRSRSYKSRGLLCKNFVEGTQTALDYALALLVELEEYRGFNFIVGDSETGTYFLSNMDCPGSRITVGSSAAAASTDVNDFDSVESELNTNGNLVRLRPGHLYGVANGSFDDESWPKIKIGKEMIRSIVQSFAPAPAEPTGESSAAAAESVIEVSDVAVATDIRPSDSKSIASRMLKAAVDPAAVAATPSSSSAVSTAPSTSKQLQIYSSEHLTLIAQAILKTVLSNRTEHDDPLFDSMSSDLARSLMSICVKPVPINVDDEPGCYVKDVEYDSLNALRKALRAELLTQLPEHVVALHGLDAVAGSPDASGESKDAAAESNEANELLFGTRTSTVIILLPLSDASGPSDVGVIVEKDRVELATAENQTIQIINISKC